MNTNQVKRQSSFNEFLDFETKKLRTINNEENVSITLIEDFSNEIFLEIFDYLDACQLYTAFSNLNNRFQHLITSSSLLLKIKVSYDKSHVDMEYCCRHVIIPNRHRIISLQILRATYLRDFFSFCLLDESFIRLESINFFDITLSKLMFILSEVQSLSRLFSLSMCITYDDDDEGEDDNDVNTDFSEMYRMIFRLHSLTYYHFTLSTEKDRNFLIPYVINDRFSSLRTLNIDHNCTLNELISILYHTPQLRRFTCEGTISPSNTIESKVSLKLPSLIKFSIRNCNMEFADFENFLKEISSPLQVLRINYFEDEEYIDPDQWNRLVSKHLPHLRKFSVKCLVNIDNIFTDVYFNSFIHYFNSRFGMERGWMLSFGIESTQIWYRFNSADKKSVKFDEDIVVGNFIYSNQAICDNPSEHTGSIIREEITDSSIQFSTPIALLIFGYSEAEWTTSFIDNVSPILLAVQFTSIYINLDNLPIDILFRIMNLLPNLETFEVSPLAELQLSNLSNEQTDILHSISIKNKITRVCSSMRHETMDSLFNLCPRMKHFQLKSVRRENLENLVRLILAKRMTHVPCLHSLCFQMYSGENVMVHELQNMIDSEKLLFNYTIECFGDTISLRWKLE